MMVWQRGIFCVKYPVSGKQFVCFFDERFILMEKEKGGVKLLFGSPHLFAKLRGCQNLTAELGKLLYLFAKEEIYKKYE